jgi:LacI family transcriptional regulator
MPKRKQSLEPAGPVRMKDVARDMGLSVATISKALQDAPDIGREMKILVRKRCAELNYQPNPAARSLVTSRTMAVGLVVPDLLKSFFAEIAMGVARKLHPRGYTLVLSNSQEDPQLEREEVEQLLARSIDGIILASAQPPRRTRLLRSIEERRVPLVLLDRWFPRIHCDYVGADNFELGRIATAHLVETGCRRVAHITSSRISTAAPRAEGYRAALAQSGLSASAELIADAPNDVDGGRDAMRRLLRLDPPPDGVFCFNDGVAAGALKEILKTGLRVPEDVAVIGAGNLLYTDFLRVPLTTIDLGCTSIGEQAADLLLDRMSGNRDAPPRKVLVPLSLIVRESSRR